MDSQVQTQTTGSSRPKRRPAEPETWNAKFLLKWDFAFAFARFASELLKSAAVDPPPPDSAPGVTWWQTVRAQEQYRHAQDLLLLYPDVTWRDWVAAAHLALTCGKIDRDGLHRATYVRSRTIAALRPRKPIPRALAQWQAMRKSGACPSEDLVAAFLFSAGEEARHAGHLESFLMLAFPAEQLSLQAARAVLQPFAGRPLDLETCREAARTAIECVHQTQSSAAVSNPGPVAAEPAAAIAPTASPLPKPGSRKNKGRLPAIWTVAAFLKGSLDAGASRAELLSNLLWRFPTGMHAQVTEAMRRCAHQPFGASGYNTLAQSLLAAAREAQHNGDAGEIPGPPFDFWSGYWKRRSKPEALQNTIREHVQSCLDGRLKVFPSLINSLKNAGRKGCARIEFLRESPGWLRSDETLRRQIVQACWRYLEAGELPPGVETRQARCCVDEAPGLALGLVLTEDPAKLDSLCESRWAQLAPDLVLTPFGDAEHHRKILQWVRAKAGPACLAATLELVLAAKSEEDLDGALIDFSDPWGLMFADYLRDFLEHPTRHVPYVRALQAWLRRNVESTGTSTPCNALDPRTQRDAPEAVPPGGLTGSPRPFSRWPRYPE